MPGRLPFGGRSPKTVPVPYEQVMTVVRELSRRLGPDAHIGFNFDPDTKQAWILVEQGVDGDALVAEILGSS